MERQAVAEDNTRQLTGHAAAAAAKWGSWLNLVGFMLVAGQMLPVLLQLLASCILSSLPLLQLLCQVLHTLHRCLHKANKSS